VRSSPEWEGFPIQRWIESRPLPYLGEPLVSEGQVVEPSGAVARLKYLPGGLYRVDVAGALGIPRPQIKEYLLVAPGQAVQQGQLLAAHCCFFEPRAALAPRSGLLGLVSSQLGYVYIREPIPLGEVGGPVRVQVAKDLELPVGRAIRRYLLVRVGQAVVRGQPLAARHARGRLTSLSPTFGRVTDIDLEEGTVTVVPLFTSGEVLAHVYGKVRRVVSNEVIDIETAGIRMAGVYGVGGITHGPLVPGPAGPEGLLDAEHVKPDWQGKVVVGGATATSEALREVARVGAAGLVLAWLPPRALLDYAGAGAKMGITGDELVTTTVVLTGGFMPQGLPQALWRLATVLQGRTATLDGTTHIRAGVIRPKLLVSVPPASLTEEAWARVPWVPQRPLTQWRQPRAGERVRILRGSFWGREGRIVQLPPEAVRVATGTAMRVARVRMDDGQVHDIPLANLEILEDGELGGQG